MLQLAKVASMWRMDTTLATLSSRSSPAGAGNCQGQLPIESENDRIRWTIFAKAMGIRDSSE